MGVNVRHLPTLVHFSMRAVPVELTVKSQLLPCHIYFSFVNQLLQQISAWKTPNEKIWASRNPSAVAIDHDHAGNFSTLVTTSLSLNNGDHIVVCSEFQASFRWGKGRLRPGMMESCSGYCGRFLCCVQKKNETREKFGTKPFHVVWFNPVSIHTRTCVRGSFSYTASSRQVSSNFEHTRQRSFVNTTWQYGLCCMSNGLVCCQTIFAPALCVLFHTTWPKQGRKMAKRNVRSSEKHYFPHWWSE